MSKKHIVNYQLNPKKLPRLSVRDKRKLDALADSDIDYSDMPEFTDAFWRHAQLLRPSPKKMVTFRIDEPVLGWFRRQGKGYQSYMNAVLRAFVESQSGSRP